MRARSVRGVLALWATVTVGFSASAATNFWDFAAAGDCSTPATAGNWSDVNCWTNAAGEHPATAPNAADAAVRFNQNAAGVTGPYYVKFSGATTVHSIQSDLGPDVSLGSANRFVLIGDETLTVAYGGAKHIEHVIFYCPVQYPAAGWGNTEVLCGEPNAGASIIINQKRLDFRYDRFATAAGETRTAQGIYAARPSYANVWVYAPESLAADAASNWKLVKGSPYATKVGGDAHALPVGTPVTSSAGGLVASGTYLKRVFDSSTIELSAPAEDNADSAALVFAAFSPKLTMPMGRFVHYNSESGYVTLYANQYASADALTVNLAQLGDDGKYAYRYGFDTTDGYYPGKVVISNAWQTGYIVKLSNCHLEFAQPTTAGKKPGFPACNEVWVNVGKIARLTVPGGTDAEIAYLSEHYGTLVKDGTGSLKLAATNSVTTKYTGAITLEAGTLEFVSGSYISAVTVSPGAELKLNGEVSGSSVTMASGAILSGGTLTVDSMVSIPPGVIFRDGASIRVRGGSGEVINELPEGRVVGDPAFWVDFTDSSAIDFVPETENKVAKIYDIRGRDSKYMTAAPTGTKYPVYETFTAARGTMGMMTQRNGENTVVLAETSAPLWSSAITNIRAVFIVEYLQDSSLSGGQFLGWSGSGIGDFMRPAQLYWYGQLFYPSTSPDYVKNAPCYMNGVRINPLSQGYPYASSASGGGIAIRTPVVAELHPLANCKADNFGFHGGAIYRNGSQAICEAIIYTNALTEAETLAVRSYLMRKWMNCEPQWTKGATGGTIASVSGDAALNQAAGETLVVDSLVSGMIEKSGAGELLIADAVAPTASLKVKGGTLTINSDPLAADSLPTGAVLHIDAGVLSTLTTNETGAVSNWKDCRDGVTTGLTAAYGKPLLTTAAELGDKPVVDFGPARTNHSATLSTHMHLGYATMSSRGHSVVGLFGTAKGGGQVVGARKPDVDQGYNSGYGLMRGGNNHGFSYSDPLISQKPTVFSTSYCRSNNFVTVRNETAIDAFVDGFTGGWDTLSLTSFINFGISGVGGTHYCEFSGGQVIAEAMYYPYGLSNVQAERIRAYLDKKWRGTSRAGYREAVVGAVEVASGATIRVTSGGTLTCSSIAGSGAVEGDVVLASGGIIEAVIAGDTVSRTVIDGAATLPPTVTVRVSGDVLTATPGYYTVFEADELTGADTINLIVDGESTLVFTVAKRGHSISLTISKGGTVLSVR